MTPFTEFAGADLDVIHIVANGYFTQRRCSVPVSLTTEDIEDLCSRVVAAVTGRLKEDVVHLSSGQISHLESYVRRVCERELWRWRLEREPGVRHWYERLTKWQQRQTQGRIIERRVDGAVWVGLEEWLPQPSQPLRSWRDWDRGRFLSWSGLFRAADAGWRY